MEMKVDSTLIKSEREKRAWSQEHLALVAGLGLRTIQRIETSGVASYESVKAIAAVYGMTASDFSVGLNQTPSGLDAPPASAPAAAHETRLGEPQRNPVVDKASSEWKQRPAWVRGKFLGSSLVRMDRRQLKQLEKIESITATVLTVPGVLALFEIFFPRATAMPLLFFSAALFTAAYLTSLNVRVGDKYSVWPWLETPSHGPVRFVFSAVLLLILSLPLWA